MPTTPTKRPSLGLCALQWHHNEHDCVSNHQPHDCLLKRLFRRRSKKTSKLRVTGLCEGNSPGTGEFPAQMASNAENVSIWWRHHGVKDTTSLLQSVVRHFTPSRGCISLKKKLHFSLSGFSSHLDASLVAWVIVQCTGETIVYTARNTSTEAVQMNAQNTSYQRQLFCYHALIQIPAWRSNYMQYKVWDEITDRFPNFNEAAIGVWEWISNFIPHLTGNAITYPCWGKSSSMLIKVCTLHPKPYVHSSRFVVFCGG